MTAALDILRAHHARRDARRLEFPEITGDDGAPLVVFAKAITPKIRARINTKAGSKPGRPVDEMKLCIEALIALAMDEDGAPLFPDNAETRAALDTAVSPDDVATIVQALTQGGPDLGN